MSTQFAQPAMELPTSPTNTPTSTSNPTPSPQNQLSNTLQVDFTWRKFKSLITSPSESSNPLYIVDYRTLSPNLVFTYPSSPKEPFGTGSINCVSINADCTLHSRHTKLKALKRFQTSYEHLSLAYSPTDTPIAMTWTSTSSLKTWDFICLDENKNPVAKFSTNIWAMKKIANIEFMGDKAWDERCREEIVVVGMTLMYCMAVRSTSILSLFGAVFARPGHIEEKGKDI